jgi:hypothetical protein
MGNYIAPAPVISGHRLKKMLITGRSNATSRSDAIAFENLCVARPFASNVFIQNVAYSERQGWTQEFRELSFVHTAYRAAYLQQLADMPNCRVQLDRSDFDILQRLVDDKSCDICQQILCRCSYWKCG